jgi:leucyl aminopeptidase (aminopeptidase T)
VTDERTDLTLQTLDQDEGARRLGELGIGCNSGITRYMRNTLFDEKIDGTIHLALGNGFPKLGGNNESAPLGHRQGPQERRVASSWTARSSRRTGAGRSSR